MMVLCFKWFDIFCLTLLASIHPTHPSSASNAKEIFSRTCIAPHIPKLGFLIIASNFGESPYDRFPSEHQSPSGYVSWPGDLCEEFLGSTKNQGQSAMAHPFSISDFWCRRLPRRLWWSYPLHPLRCPSSQHCFWQETTVTTVSQQ